MNKPNRAKRSFLAEIEKKFIHQNRDRFVKNISFSFEYFDKSQEAGQDFSDWTHPQLLKLIEKVKSYCGNSIFYWTTQRIGTGSGHVLEIYGGFPKKSAFVHPPFVPQDVEWARFRLEDDMRLIGFVLNTKSCNDLGVNKNTFYVVFLDSQHKFYIS